MPQEFNVNVTIVPMNIPVPQGEDTVVDVIAVRDKESQTCVATLVICTVGGREMQIPMLYVVVENLQAIIKAKEAANGTEQQRITPNE